MENNKNAISKLFVAICAAYVTCLLLSNLIAGKMMAIGDVTLPAAVILFPVTYIFGDIFTEVYGFRNARTIIWIGFACSFFAVAIYMVTLVLPHPDYWTGQEAYETVLGTTPRVFAASLIGYLFGEFSNSMIISRLKVMTNGKRLWVRTILSTIVGEAFDSIIFIVVSFWGTMEPSVLLRMILFQYLFKVCYEIILTPVTYLFVGWLKKKENVDVYDHGVKYRVF